MKANEFVKKFGWEESKALVNAQSWTMRQIALSTTVDTKELTRLVESHELVEKLGGIDKCKGLVHVCIFKGRGSYASRLKQAIADVEACGKVGS